MVKSIVFGVMVQAGLPGVQHPSNTLKTCIQENLHKHPEQKMDDIDWNYVDTNDGVEGLLNCKIGGQKIEVICDHSKDEFKIYDHCPSLEMAHVDTFAQCQKHDQQRMQKLQVLAKEKGFTIDSIEQDDDDKMDATAQCVTDGNEIVRTKLRCHIHMLHLEFSADDCKDFIQLYKEEQAVEDHDLDLAQFRPHDEFKNSEIAMGWSVLPFQSEPSCEKNGGLFKQNKTAQEKEEQCDGDCCKPQWVCHLWYADIKEPEFYCKKFGGEDARFEWDETNKKSNENRCDCGCCVPVSHFDIISEWNSDHLVNHVYGLIKMGPEHAIKRVKLFYDLAEKHLFSDVTSGRLLLDRSLEVERVSEEMIMEIQFAHQHGLPKAIASVKRAIKRLHQNQPFDRREIDAILRKMQNLLDSHSAQFVNETYQQEIA